MMAQRAGLWNFPVSPWLQGPPGVGMTSPSSFPGEVALRAEGKPQTLTATRAVKGELGEAPAHPL